MLSIVKHRRLSQWPAVLVVALGFFLALPASGQSKKEEKQYEQLQKDLQELEKQRAELQAGLKAYNDKLSEVTKNVQNLEKQYATVAVRPASGDGSQSQLMQATQQMQETQMSFNLQYLQLQNSMQNENRQFTMVSNIMKTKHDTTKNTISNMH
jgi:septal ring factor EnvC (AmiA/AmiB activator)